MPYTVMMACKTENKGKVIRAECPYWTDADSPETAMQTAQRDFGATAEVLWVVPGHMHPSGTFA